MIPFVTASRRTVRAMQTRAAQAAGMSCSDVLRGALADGALGLSQEQKAAHCFVYMERALQDHLTAQWDHKTHREMQEKNTVMRPGMGKGRGQYGLERNKHG